MLVHSKRPVAERRVQAPRSPGVNQEPRSTSGGARIQRSRRCSFPCRGARTSSCCTSGTSMAPYRSAGTSCRPGRRCCSGRVRQRCGERAISLGVDYPDEGESVECEQPRRGLEDVADVLDRIESIGLLLPVLDVGLVLESCPGRDLIDWDENGGRHHLPEYGSA